MHGATAADGEQPAPVLVDHGGRAYRLDGLLTRLSPAELAEIEAAAPRTGQVAWDEVLRRWPALAEEIVVAHPISVGG